MALPRATANICLAGNPVGAVVLMRFSARPCGRGTMARSSESRHTCNSHPSRLRIETIGHADARRRFNQPDRRVVMVDILHRVGIKASLDEVYRALATREGAAAWWTTDTQGQSKI